jgi:alpha/beta superfamily hydrolase
LDSSTGPPPSEFRPPVPQAVTIAGPVGALEGRIENPLADGAPPDAVGIVCHPHPLHGGTMQNKVVHTVARAMQEARAPTVRFNFRGVGASEGVYADGRGEIDDALSVVDWARANWHCDRVWLGGFSFGAAVALQAASAARPDKLVTIAPPVGRLITQPIARPTCPWLVVQGDRDELVDFAAVQRWVAGYAPQAPDLLVMRDAEHFFHGRLAELRAGVLRFLVSGA